MNARVAFGKLFTFRRILNITYTLVQFRMVSDCVNVANRILTTDSEIERETHSHYYLPHSSKHVLYHF